MTRYDASETPEICSSADESEAIWFETRAATLGSGLIIRRALPLRKLRMIGAWCFLDHFGPHQVEEPRDAMWVGAHPHTGLQTVTWLLDGEVRHRDSIGSDALIQPGQLNVMTSGKGISHTEETPEEHSTSLHGIQFWVALPDAVRDMEPAFEQRRELPQTERENAQISVFVGRGFGEESPATVHSPLVGADIALRGRTSLELEAGWEYGVKSLDGPIMVDGRELNTGEFAYLPPGRRSLVLEASRPTRLIVVGGEPFPEKILLWWNFVGRTQEELVDYVKSWNAGDRFGEVHGFPGDRLPAPELRGVRL